MPFVNSAEAGKVVKLLLRKETTPLETTAQEFRQEFSPAGYYRALCAAIDQLQVSLQQSAPWLYWSLPVTGPWTYSSMVARN